MSAEHAVDQEADSENLIANVNVYWKVSALALAGVAVLGLIVNAIGGNNAYIPDVEAMESILVFDWAHNILHVGLFAIAAVLGFGSFSSAITANAAKIVGVTYLALGVLGFFPPVVDALDSLLALHLEAGENVIHLLLGGWGAYAGFTS